MAPVTGTVEGLCDYAEALEAAEQDEYSTFTCPICGTHNDEHTDCGCFADLHYGD